MIEVILKRFGDPDEKSAPLKIINAAI